MTAIADTTAPPILVRGRAAAQKTGESEATGPLVRRGQHHALRLVARLFALVLVLVVALATPIVGGAPSAEAGKTGKSKLVTRDFSSSGQIDMPNAGPATPYNSPIKVNAFKKYKKARITDVNVTLRNFGHDRPDDVDVLLVFDNTQAFLLGDAGGSTGVNNLDLTLDDQAASELPNSTELESGAYRPFDHVGADNFIAPAPLPNGNFELSVYNGADPDGTWRLYVVDDAGTMTGEIAGGWKLEITAKVKKDKK